MVYIYIMIGEMLWTYTKYLKTQVWKGMGQVTAKNFFPETILAKIVGAR